MIRYYSNDNHNDNINHKCLNG